jgi:hypothetical protein
LRFFLKLATFNIFVYFGCCVWVYVCTHRL